MTIRLTIASDLELAGAQLLSRLVEERFASRLFQQDATLWGASAREEAATRLGWVDPFAASHRVLAEAQLLREQLHAKSITNIVLCGMGGSSLGPEVIAREAGVTLSLVDSMHPEVVRRALECDLAHSAIVISSKSGGTLETLTHSELFRETYRAAGLDPTEHIIYVTDPETPFAKYAQDGYRVFLADPNVGGRFSALTAMGIVPTVLAGADISRLLADAEAACEQLRVDSRENPALRIASALVAALPSRYVLLLTEAAGNHWGLGDWIEQLIAESTGKNRTGLLPIALPDSAYELSNPPANSVVVGIGAGPQVPQGVAVEASLGEQLIMWEVATAALGALLRINPFDQPDVEAAKLAAHAMLAENPEASLSELPIEMHGLLEELTSALPAGGYVALQAFVDPESPHGAAARELRNDLAHALGVPVALGWGPRYLHSTGQLHKGGPELGVFVQIVDAAAEDLALPSRVTSLVKLLLTQAGGDKRVLESRGRTVLVRTPGAE